MRPATIGVLYAHPLDAGGVETQVLSLMRGCEPDRFRWLVAASASQGFADRARALGAQLVPWQPRGALDPGALLGLVRLLRRHPVDLLHLHSPRALGYGRAVAWCLRLPLVATIHMPAAATVGGRGVAPRWRHRVYGAAERRLLRGFPGRVIHVSARAREEDGRVPADRCVVIENGVELAPETGPVSAEALREALGASPAEVVVSCVARLDPQKGLDVLIDALAHLPAEPAWRAWLIGDGPLEGRLRERAAALGLAERVRFLGRREDVPALLRASDVFALPSRHETTPFALLEAMAAGLPAAATDVGDVPRLLGCGAAGLVVPPGDAEALAGALRALIDDAGLRAGLGERARARVREYSDVRMSERTAAVYASLLESARQT